VTIRHRSLLSIPAAVAALTVGACGGGTEGGIPPSRADALVEDLDQVARAVSATRCDDAEAQAQSFSDRVVELPESVDAELVARLQEGAGLLQEQAAKDCEEDQMEEEPAEEVAPPVPEVPEETETFEQPPPVLEEEPEEEPVEPPEETPPPPPDDDGRPGNGNGRGNDNGNGGGSGGATPPLPDGGSLP